MFSLAASGLAACSTDTGEEAAKDEAQQIASNVHVLSSKNDTARTGHNAQERILNTANVRSSMFGRIFSRPIDGQAYAQPLYASNVNGKNLVFVATEHNSVYAFDADDTRAEAPPVWHKNFGPSLPAADTGCGLLGPEIGITSTPVIDLASKTMWFTTRNKENGRPVHKLHALDIATGEPRASSPTVITAKARGNGDESVGGVITFNPLKQMQRPGLLKVGNEIVIGFASQCDIAPYHGWLLGYDATTLQQNRVHITTPNGGEGGIWNGGVGINADENGDIYFTAADAYDRSTTGPWNGEGNEADSIVRLHDTGTGWEKVTSFMPFDHRTVGPQDLSLGNGGGILIPGTKLYVAGDKRGVNFLVNRDNMGGTADNDSQIVQKWQGSRAGAWGGGAYYRTGPNTGIYYQWGRGDGLRGYLFDGEKFNTTAMVNTTTGTGYPGVTLSLSSDGNNPGTAIVWGVRGKRTSAGLAATTGLAALEAYDALDVTKKLYSSDEVASDQLGQGTKFAPPTIANGKVFVGTSSNQLVVYGLRNGAGPVTPPPVTEDAGPGPGPGPGPVTDAGPAPSDAPTWDEIYSKILGPGTPGHCSGTGGCHTQLKGGFKCGTNKDDCYAGLVAARLINPASPATSTLINENESPLAWFGGGMPIDNPVPNDAAKEQLTAWVLAGAKKD
ncbi:MAG: PQQ-binding-like beta-propeller repeat protein [Labilithrix sp.]|nr:PQQ-binding-like beta-propeller repeat protein [Labilithrix sp.]MCW5813616.1 PQQ-binding-like beta-propeller repeat protein [Labilithrix sp.]